MAQESTNPADATIVDFEYPRVIVRGIAEDQLSGVISVDRELIDTLPLKSGSLAETVTILPGIQTQSDYSTSLNGGEILAPEVSISGGKYYDNQVQVDGISVNQMVDPSNTRNTTNDIPGNIQAPIINNSLMGEIDVYRYNIPASLGGFTGGVISASIRDPKPAFSLLTSYRTTSDDFTEFHVDADDRDDFYSSTDESQQPRFRKHDWKLEADIPLTFKTTGLFAYHQVQSKIPLHHLDGTKTQRRKNENFTIKLARDFSNTKATLTGIYAPYQGDYFKEDTFASDYSLHGGGLILMGNVQHELSVGSVRLDIGLSDTASERDDAPNHFSWAVTPQKPWGADAGLTISKEGGYGDITKGQTNYSIKPSFAFAPVQTGLMEHHIDTGLEYVYSEASFDRDDKMYVYSRAQVDPLVTCSPGDVACVDSDQFLTRRAIYDPAHADAIQKQTSLYIDDKITIGRVTLRPGLRFTNESFTENNNLSPRLAVAIDFLGDGGTLLRGGANRYYSTSPITFKLREAIVPIYKEERPATLTEVSPGVWMPSSVWAEYSRATYVNKYSDLKSPYSDEYAAGIEQQILSGKWGRINLDFIRREGKDEITKEVDFASREYTLNNNGQSRHYEYSLSWELYTRQLDVVLNATYQDSRSSHADYDDFYNDPTSEEIVWFEGEAIPRWQLPAEDFNRPWSGNLLLTYRHPFRRAEVSFSNLTRYVGAYQELDKTSTIPADAPPEVVDAYEVIERDDALFFDWKIDIAYPVVEKQVVTFTLEVFNVFNTKSWTSSEDSDYFLGRQFWAGLSYQF